MRCRTSFPFVAWIRGFDVGPSGVDEAPMHGGKRKGKDSVSEAAFESQLRPFMPRPQQILREGVPSPLCSPTLVA